MKLLPIISFINLLLEYLVPEIHMKTELLQAIKP